jgi:hypothetical protein
VGHSGNYWPTVNGVFLLPFNRFAQRAILVEWEQKYARSPPSWVYPGVPGPSVEVPDGDAERLVEWQSSLLAELSGHTLSH